MLQYLSYALAKWGVEIFKNKVGVRLANGAFACIREVVAKKNIM